MRRGQETRLLIAEEKRRRWWLVVVLLGGIALVMPLFNLFSRRPDNLGPLDGQLRPCPESPNCVSTFATDDLHKMEPFPFADSPDAALARLKTAILLQPRAADHHGNRRVSACRVHDRVAPLCR